jgi:hypothetical protein
MPQINPDGTVQVAAPTQSAFAPQPTQAPPPPMQAPPGAAQGAPGVSDAIFQAIKALAMHFGPKAITEAPAREKQQEEQALGNKF